MAGEMPSTLIFELLAGGLSGKEAVASFITSVPESRPAFMNLSRLCMRMYTQHEGSIVALDYFILNDIHQSGVLVTVPPTPW